MIRAIVFDFNGVLVDDEHVHFQLLQQLLQEEGISLTEQQYLDEYLGYDDRGCIETALQRAGRTYDSAFVDELIRRKASRYYTAAERGLRYFPGAAECVQVLAVRWPVAICSGALRAEIDFSLDRLGITEAVEVVIAAEDTERCKPDPEGYLLTLDALQSIGHEDLEAGHVLVIEDSLAGIQAAKAAGMWAVGVPHSYSPEELRAAGADAVAASLAEIDPVWLERLFSAAASP